jgi:hypothetical protein
MNVDIEVASPVPVHTRTAMPLGKRVGSARSLLVAGSRGGFFCSQLRAQNTGGG